MCRWEQSVRVQPKQRNKMGWPFTAAGLATTNVASRLAVHCAAEGALPVCRCHCHCAVAAAAASAGLTW